MHTFTFSPLRVPFSLLPRTTLGTRIRPRPKIDDFSSFHLALVHLTGASLGARRFVAHRQHAAVPIYCALPRPSLPGLAFSTVNVIHHRLLLTSLAARRFPAVSYPRDSRAISSTFIFISLFSLYVFELPILRSPSFPAFLFIFIPRILPVFFFLAVIRYFIRFLFYFPLFSSLFHSVCFIFARFHLPFMSVVFPILHMFTTRRVFLFLFPLLCGRNSSGISSRCFALFYGLLSVCVSRNQRVQTRWRSPFRVIPCS